MIKTTPRKNQEKHKEAKFKEDVEKVSLSKICQRNTKPVDFLWWDVLQD